MITNFNLPGGLGGMAATTTSYSSAGKVDARTREVAEGICNVATTSQFEIEPGHWVPAWVMFVSEATKLIEIADKLAKVKPAKR